MPGVVAPTLPSAFAIPAAYGDLTACLLAIIAVWALSARAPWAIAAVWLFNLEGTIDLLFAFYQGLIAIGLPPGSLGAAFYIPTLIVPPLLIMQGELDDNVLPSAQEKFATSYRAAGGHCELEIFTGCEHMWVAKPGPQTDRAAEVVKDFIARQLSTLRRAA